MIIHCFHRHSGTWEGNFLRKNRLDSALVLFQTSPSTIPDLSGYKKYRSNNYNLIGRIYLRQNLYDLALENFLNALRSGKEQNNNSSIGGSYVLMSNYYNKTGQKRFRTLLCQTRIGYKPELGPGKRILLMHIILW